MRRVTSRQNPLVARYRAAARGDQSAPLLLDGMHLLSEALAAGLRIREAAVAAGDGPELAAILERLALSQVEVVEASASVMAALSPVRSSSRIVALADRPEASSRSHRAGVPRLPLEVVIAGVQDPGNVGAIIRVAEAGGATAVVAAGPSADPFGWKALRGSMGSALRLPVESVPDVSAALAKAKQRGLRIVATVPHGGRPFFAIDYTGPTALVIGGEGAGLEASLMAAADERATIPMQPPVESLNTAVAAALIVYEARRQRALHKLET